MAAILSLALFATSVAAHGRVTSPTPRTIGTAFEAACGQQVYYNQASDPNGNIQTMAQVGATQSDYNADECELALCKGYKYADSTASLETYTPGQTVDFTVDIVAPHTGTANVSIVDTETNTVIGDTLIYWDVYASTATTIPANETSFSVTIPEDLTGCDTAGKCVLQWWWDARSIDQTYMSCVDFVTSGSSSSGSASSSGSSSSSVVAATSSSVVASSSSAAPAATTSSSSVQEVATTSTPAAAATTSSSSSSVLASTLKTVVASSTKSSSSVSASATAKASSTGKSTCSKRKRNARKY